MSTLPGLEAITVARWVYATLSGDPTLQALLGGPQGAAQRVVEGTYTGTADLWITFTVLDPQDVPDRAWTLHLDALVTADGEPVPEDDWPSVPGAAVLPLASAGGVLVWNDLALRHGVAGRP